MASSPKQYRAKSTPKKITLEGGIKMSMPMAIGRKTPTTKTVPKICNECSRGVGSASL